MALNDVRIWDGSQYVSIAKLSLPITGDVYPPFQPGTIACAAPETDLVGEIQITGPSESGEKPMLFAGLQTAGVKLTKSGQTDREVYVTPDGLYLNRQQFPATSGTPGQVLTTNGAGVLSWSSTAKLNYTALFTPTGAGIVEAYGWYAIIRTDSYALCHVTGHISYTPNENGADLIIESLPFAPAPALLDALDYTALLPVSVFTATQESPPKFLSLAGYFEPDTENFFCPAAKALQEAAGFDTGSLISASFNASYPVDPALIPVRGD